MPYKLTHFKYCTVSGLLLFEKSRWWEPLGGWCLHDVTMTSQWPHQWWRFRHYCTFPLKVESIFFFCSFFGFFWTRNCTFFAPAIVVYCTVIHIARLVWPFRSFTILIADFGEDLEVFFGVGGDLSWHPTPSASSSPLLKYLTGHFSPVRTCILWSGHIL